MKKKNRISKRILSFVLAVNLVIVNVCFDGIFPFRGLFNTTLTVNAYSPTEITDENDPAFDPDTNGDVIITSLNMLKDYAYYYSNSTSFADNHEDDHLKLAMGASEYTIDSDYIPIGTEEHPFNGQFLFTTVNSVYTLQTYAPLFDYISDDAIIGGSVTLNLYNQAANHVLLANHVKHGNGTAVWNLYLNDTSIVDYGSSVSYSGVIGEMLSNASVGLNFTDNSSTAVSNSSGDAGMICNTMQSGSKITLSLTRTSTDAFDVTSTSGNAGALVGTMNPSSSLELVKIPSASSSSTVKALSDGYYAGGLVGQSEDASVTVVSGGMTVGDTSGITVIPVQGAVTATTGGAGGLYGRYINSGATFDLKDYNITATVYAKYCGGVFGVLENNKGEDSAVELTIKNTGGTGTVNINSETSTTYATTGYYGGIAGKYTTDALTNSLVLDSFSVSATANASFDSFGGAIGIVDSLAYVKADGLSVTAIGTAQGDSAGFFGGLIGKTSTANGVFVDLGSFTLSADSTGFTGGGVVGNFTNGVLRLRGVTDMSAAKSQKGGQLVGENDNVLVYALGTGSNYVALVVNAETGEVTTPASGWTFKRSNGSKVDDLGTWGEVVRLANIEDSTNGILTLDSTNHTVTIKAAETSMGTQAAFAKTALNIQLNQGSGYGCLLFTEGSANTRTTLLGGTLTLTADISLTGTGINGFMRDGGTSVGNFTGTLDGGSKTVTLAIGEKYGITSADATIDTSTTGEGLGQIYAHPYNGLFAVIGNGTTAGKVNSVTIAGTVNVRNTFDGMNIGGIAAVSQGSTSLSGITASQTVNYGEPSSITGTESKGKNIGGIIGIANNSTDNGTIAITGKNTISTTFNISDNFASWNALGALIGKVTSPKFTINIAQGGSDTLTVSHTMVDAGTFTAGTNADGGGLIGYITSGTYTNRIVNINHLDFNNCTIVNKASETAGGFLGYAWLDTTTTIDGLTVTNGTITNSTPKVGVMCYEATGKWKVNSLTVTKMSLSGGAGTSLGMLVNKAYNGSKGLYLDVLNSGYTLTKQSGSTGVSLPASLAKYDELAAYTAENAAKVQSGDFGVISINMNATRDTANATVTATGTYQNQLSVTSTQTSNYANDTARYYYNLDKMSYSDAGQNLLLWSVSKYVASNISNEFIKGENDTYGTTFTNTISGVANMTGLSFYPIALKDSVTLSGLTLTMDYSGLYDAESVFTANNLTDSYTRDPALANQHYLMQSGLFTSLPNTKTLNIRGANTLKGDFLELDNVSMGVLISGTSNGSIVSASGSTLVLDGIIAKTTAKGSYDDGYLLVNNITRKTSVDTADDITVRLEGISTTNTYNAGTTVAKSLLGAASGSNLKIEFTKIKLDSRNAGTLSSDTNLNTAYGTTRSIFTDSTFLASISTDARAQLKYYYKISEDWGSTGTNGTRWVTYGKEVTDSVEYREDGISLENKYDGSNYYTHPTTYQSGSAYTFSTGFLPYVATPFTASQANALYNRELKVNVAAEGLTEGCGTYNDPYLITDGKQLVAVSKFIANGQTSDLAEIKLPKDKDSFDTLGKNTLGSRWCTDTIGETYHATFEPNSAGTGYENGSITWTKENVQYYLANAYYKIDNDITLSGDPSTGFVGLGGTTANTAFRGVIVGKTDSDGEPLYTITNNSSYPFINISNGCVIKDITVNQNADVSVAGPSAATIAGGYFGYTHACNYYGGMIGEIMGGDNIIDNSYVTFTTGKKVTLTGTYGTLVPVGGYVGVVVFGGLIFKNMDASKTTLANTKLNVVKQTTTAASTTQITVDVDKLDGKNLLFNHGDITSNGKVYMTDTSNGNNRKGFKTTDSCSGAVSILFEKIDGTENKYYLKLDTEQATKYLKLIPDNNLGLGNKGDDGTQITVVKDGNCYKFYCTTNNKTVYVHWKNGVGFTGIANANDGNNKIYLEEIDEVIEYNLADNNRDTNEVAWSAIYVNPIVGRVINGYAINETETDAEKETTGQFSVTEDGHYHDDDGTSRTGTQHSLQNGTKHYSIADVNKSETNKLGVTPVTESDGTINVPNAQALFVLSLITQSCAGTATTATGDYSSSLSYGTNTDVYGMSHNANYTSVGSATSQSDADYVLASNDTAANTAVPYIVKWYTDMTNGATARCVTSSLGYYDINLTGSGTYQLPDSFRGLGCVGNMNSAFTMHIDTFDGKGLTIDEDIYLNKFQYDNYFDSLHSGTTQSYSSDNTLYNVSTQTVNHGLGLFDSVITSGSTSKFTNFTLSGSINSEIYNNTYSATDHEITIYGNTLAKFLSVGGVCGTSLNGNYITFDQIALDSFSACGSSMVGGLLGYSGNSGAAISIKATKCSATDLSIKMNSSTNQENAEKPRNAMGGYVGKCDQGKVIIEGDSTNRSNVTIKSFGYETSTYKDHRAVAGGLVGFAGNGCTIKNMNVSPSTGYTVTIGSDYTAYAGGLVGLMQPYKEGEPSCEADFENCTVTKINVNGHYAGGFYGGKWFGGDNKYVPYKITLNNCQMVGDTSTNNTITGNSMRNADGYAGGFLGCGNVFTSAATDSSNIEIANCKVSNYTITSTAETNSGYHGYVGGFIGYTGSSVAGSSITCYIHDSSIENCTIGAGDNYAGGAIGQVYRRSDSSNNKILGYNIKLDTVTIGSTYKGAWIGHVADADDTTSIQFTGVGIYGNGFTQNVGNRSDFDKASFVFADYDGACGGTIPNGQTARVYPTGVSTFNDDNNVTMPLYPYVNINPQSSMGTGENISGDGAVLRSSASETEAYAGKTAEKTMALKLYEDTLLSDSSATNYSRRYTTFSTYNATNDAKIKGDNKIDVYLKRASNESGDRISTWETETGTELSGVDDFAMIVIANEDPEETTKLITRYIQLVTNTSTDYSISSTYYTVVPTACVYNSTSHDFETTGGAASIAYNPGATHTDEGFAVVREGADSFTANKFTLLDVQFKDPLHTDNVAYHLYIPVYVKRSISATFSSTALSGTNALSSSYTSYLTTNHRLIENLDNWITAYIRYQYSTEDINAILNSGILDWNGNKQVTLTFSNNATGTSLPDGTQLVLIDPNGNIDKAYYALGSELSGNTFSLSDFHKNYTGGTAFSEQPFSEILGGSVTVTDLNGTEDEGTGYYNSGTSEDYDIKIGENYYSYVSDKTGRYSLTASRAFNEDYYISMLVPSDEDGDVYLFDIQAPTTLSGRMVTYITNAYHADVLLGDLFEQNFETHTVTSTTGAEVINESNNTITINVTSVVKLKDTDETRRGFYATYLSGTALYHADVVSFTRHDVGGSDNTIYGTDESDIVTSGTVDGTTRSTKATRSSSYITVKTGDICSQVIQGASAAEGYDGATITQTIAVTFPGFDEEFPARPADQETTYGVNASVSSNISYDNDELTYSGKKITYTDTSRYYVENANSATLKYEADDELDRYDSVGSASYNYSHLGNNGFDRLKTCMWPENLSGMPISATAKYNAAAVTNYEDAVTIRYTLMLYKKTDVTDPETGNITKVEYQQVDIDNYLMNVKLYGGSTTAPLTKSASSDDQRYVYSESVSAANVDERLFTIGTYYEVVTGGNFHDYANYRVVLEVRLLNSGGATISNSTQKDHIVYTNAKIYPEVIDLSGSGD